MPLYVVDTIVTYRMRYVVDAKEQDHALDEVTMKSSGANKDHFAEVTQKYLDETIIDSRKITLEEYNAMIKRLENDSSECSSYWMGDKLIRKIEYDAIDPTK